MNPGIVFIVTVVSLFIIIGIFVGIVYLPTILAQLPDYIDEYRQWKKEVKEAWKRLRSGEE